MVIGCSPAAPIGCTRFGGDALNPHPESGDSRKRLVGWSSHAHPRESMTVDSTTTAPTEPVTFVRAISRVGAVALVAGSMIGAGIFIVPAEMMRTVSSPGLFLL